MKRAILTGCCVLLAACSDDPARSVKILSRPPAPVTTTEAPTPAAAAPDRNRLPDFCPPPDDAPGPGSFRVGGPCAFRHRPRVSCQSLADDFIVAIPRKAKNGASLVVYLNVEHYSGPGDYDGAQLFVAVQSGTSIYRWSSDAVHAVVGAKEAFVTLPETRLDQEALRVQCSRLIGPESNYQYQCAASSEANLALDNAAEIASGTLVCEAQPTRPENRR